MLLSLPLLLAATAAAQNFDTSGNGSLKGDYFIREVLIAGQNKDGTITSANSVIGVATFDGKGNYTFKGTGTATGGNPTAESFNGTYAASGNGLLYVQSFISTTDFCYGGVSAVGPSAFVASATEGTVVDTLVAIPAGATASAGSLKGNYSLGFVDFLGANINNVREGSFNVTADGAGNMGNITVNGVAVNLQGKQISQAVNGVTYSLSGTGSGSINFGNANTAQLLSGSKTFYISADGNIVMAGDPAGFDLMVGIRSLTANATNATTSGLYYIGTLEDIVTVSGSTTSHAIDAYYGSTNATGSGTSISHNRLQSFANAVFDYTYSDQYSVASNGTFYDGELYNYTLGVNGQAFIATGTPGYYSLLVGFGAPKFSGPGVYLNPLGVVNAANFAPITNPIAPNEIVAIFGTGLAAATVKSSTFPLPTSLGGVQVTVNGVFAPLFYVTPGQIAFGVPQMISPFYKVLNATIQVINNNVKSNAVTVYTSLDAPGVFSQGGNGVGPALAQHASGLFPLVTSANPAKIGESVVVYASGLGSVTPTVADGAPAPGNPPASVNDTTDELDFGFIKSTLAFAGLVPTLSDFYQLNATVASGTATGNENVFLATGDAVTRQTTLSITGGAVLSSQAEQRPAVARPRPQSRPGQTIKTEGLRDRAR